MTEALGLLATNAMGAVVLAAIASLIGNRVRPAVRHVLWLLVLVELASPPVLLFELIPDPFHRAPQEATVVTTPGPAPAGVPSARSTAAVLAPTVPISVVGVGALFVLSVGLVRGLRYRRNLHDSVETPPALQRQARSVAERLGLRRAPRIRVTRELVPPALWPRAGGCEVVVPKALLDVLTASEREVLIAHEFAHVRRRDHWIRPLELLVSALYWWFPIAVRARRRLRAAEELCCDAHVLRAYPGRSRTYAETLLKTLELLGPDHPATPGLATGAADTDRMKERLTMIMKETVAAPLGARARGALLVAALLTIVVSPTWSPHAAVRNEGTVDSHAREMLEYRRQELELQKEMHAIQAKRMLVEQKVRQASLEQDVARTRAEIERMKSARETEAAAQLQSDLDELLRWVEVEQRRAKSDQAFERERVAVELQMQALQLECEERAIAGQPLNAKELEAQARALERQQLALQVKDMERALERQAADLARQMSQLEKLGAEDDD